MSWYPTINGDGSVGEFQNFGLNPTIQKTKDMKVIILNDFKGPDVKTDPVETYDLQGIDYIIGQKKAELFYYVSRDFEKDDKNRERMVMNIINEHRPWFFTYATRVGLDKERKD